jgi:hypothetical protein
LRVLRSQTRAHPDDATGATFEDGLITQTARRDPMKDNKLFRYGGVVASVILIAFGIASIAIGAAGRSTVHDNLRAEQITGTPDMTPKAIRAEGAAAGLKSVDYPTCSVAGQSVDNGSRARCFAQYMRVHALEATGGLVYAQMGQFLDANGKPTDDKAKAAIDPKTKQPVANGARTTWVNETALSTALNTSYFAENVALFSMVMGIALLLTGIGFGVLTLGLLPRRRPDGEPVTASAPRPITA